jgi:predicted metal-dependent hydrolase
MPAAVRCAAPSTPGLAPRQLSLFDSAPVEDEAASGATTPRLAPSALATQPSAGALDRLPATWSAPEPAAPIGPLPRHPQAQHRIVLAGQELHYHWRRARRRSIGFAVGADGLTVSAPRWVRLADVEAALREKERWVLRKLHDAHERKRRHVQLEWRDGGSLPFLGEPMALVLDPRASGAVLHEAAGLPGVPQRSLHLGLPQDASAQQIRDLVHGWMQRQARLVFQERCTLYAQRLGVQVKRIALSSAQTRWGSASADGSIRLHWRLMHFSLDVIDYVVTHELAHLKEMNHSPRFWAVVRSVLPGFEAPRHALRSQVLPADPAA